MPKFAVLMHEDDHAWMRLPAAERERLLALYLDWVRDLKARGLFAGGEPIGEGGRVLRAAEGAVSESAYDESRGVLTGFFLIEAADLPAATTIARGCPALLHGETVIVRPVGHSG